MVDRVLFNTAYRWDEGTCSTLSSLHGQTAMPSSSSGMILLPVVSHIWGLGRWGSTGGSSGASGSHMKEA